MRILLGSAAAVSAAVALSVGASQGAQLLTGANAAAGAPEVAITPEEAARLAKQASFGPTPELISAIVARKSAAAWLDDQFALSSSTYADLAAKATPGNFCSALKATELDNCNRDNFSATQVQMRFYADAIGQDDQLRQRVAFAFSQIIVASDVDVHNTSGLATFNQILLSNAFGNYRDILKAVTLNGFMGDYLDMADSNKTQPSENYARELMQLFSIGTVLLNADGTPQVDGSGMPVAAYANADVKEIARSLTGWTWPRLNGVALSDHNNRDLSRPMIADGSRFDAGEKSFLGKTVPASATQQSNVDAVIDAVFNHPNTGPFISKRLIQQLTLSNPTPAYVGRVAAVFANNSAGVRGDMKAVIRAIYLDPEARGASQFPGKVKEPVLMITSLARAIGFKTDGYIFTTRDGNMGQAPFRAPSVFNYYPSEYPLPQGNGVLSPSSKILTTATIIERHNFIYDLTISGETTRADYKPSVTALGTTPLWSSWEANGSDDSKTIDRINLVMLNGTLTAQQRQAVAAAMAAIKANDPAIQARRRAQAALYMVASSPLFQVDR